MNDAEIDALGVRVLDNLCADLAPSNPESEEEDATLEEDIARPTVPGYEDQMEDQSRPKRKWKRKIYPTSTVHGSARIQTTKKFHNEI